MDLTGAVADGLARDSLGTSVVALGGVVGGVRGADSPLVLGGDVPSVGGVFGLVGAASLVDVVDGGVVLVGVAVVGV